MPNFVKLAALSVIAGMMSGCAFTGSSEAVSEPIIFGVTECCEVLDPANTYSNANWPYLQQIYPSLVNSLPGQDELVLDAAESIDFVNPTTLAIRVRDGLVFSNGNPLTASDVAFSLNRQINIQAPNGPSSLLHNVESASVTDDFSLELKLKVANDVTILKVLSSMAGLIVDEEVFSADRIMENQEIINGESFGGPYVIESFEEGSLLVLAPNPRFSGAWGKPKNSGVIIRAYQDMNNLVADFEAGRLDAFLSYRESLTPQVKKLLSNSNFVLSPGPTTESVSLYISHNSLPFGNGTSNPDSEKANLVRKALSVLIDRYEVNETAFFGSYLPMFSSVPHDLEFSIGAEFEAKNQQVSSNTRVELAEDYLREAGISAPIPLSIITSSSRWGDLGIRLATNLQKQLETGGLFEVRVLDLEWEEWRQRRRSGEFELGLHLWGADFADADNYLTPLAKTDARVKTGYSNPYVDQLIDLQLSSQDPNKRAQYLREIQVILDEELPFIPLLSGGPSVISRGDIEGVDVLVNREFKYLLGFLSR